MTPDEYRLWIRLEGIFTPSVRARRDTFYKNDYKGEPSPRRFVHYTSAEAALNIIKTKRIWMRNTTCMSDYREVQHGYEMLRNFFSKESNKKDFFSALDACSADSAKEAIGLFDDWSQDIALNTFITCISEHDDREDLHGRLSMWRAFGGNLARVGIVFNVPWFSAGALALKLRAGPVLYLNEQEVTTELNSVIKQIGTNCDFLSSLDRSYIVGSVFQMLVGAVTCLKHEGFHEEREWRVLYAPNREPSPFMERSTEIIGGVPQIIYKIPLDAKVSEEIADIDIGQIFDRVIIGPSPYPWVIYQAFVTALTDIGVSDAEKRVVVSAIPIRA